ncbi:MAG: YlmH/Sll1252 family protein, partial [Oscillospiraceae bacterium]
MDKEKLLRFASGDDRLLLAKVLDKWEQARTRNIPTCTGFLTTAEQTAAAQLLTAASAGDTALFWGGYEAAERKLLVCLPDWQTAETFLEGDALPIRALRCVCRPEFGLTHRDYLGALMGLGIVREKIGDILVTEDGCDLLVASTVADFLLQGWETAGRAPVAVTAIETDALRCPEIKCELVRDTVMSLRLDAVVAAGFHLARSRAATLIAGGRVQVNGRDCDKTDKLVAQGDTLSARGLGKCELVEVGGLSRKGRTGIVLKRY